MAINKHIVRTAEQIFKDQVKEADGLFETLAELDLPEEFLEHYTVNQLANMLVSAVMFEMDWRFKPMLPQELRDHNYNVLTREF